MIKLKSLLLEDKLTALHIGKVLKAAYSTIFDIDRVIVVETRNLMSPSYMHQYASANIFFVYKMRGFFVYHKLHHYKFPRQELKGLSNQEWMDMLKHAERMPPVQASTSDIKSRNPMISLNASVYEAENENTSWFQKNPIGESDHNRNIGELVTNVKKMIDKYIEGEGGPRDEVPPTPVAPKGIKEPALKEEVGKEDVIQLQKRLTEKYPQLESLYLSLQTNGALFIHQIRVKKEERRKGIGRKVMDEIKAFADQYGLVITLSPEAESRNKEKLDRFYKSLGFAHNKGRKKDYRYSSFFGPTMIRRPLTEGYHKVVIGSIGMDDVVQSYETRKTHTQCGIQRGKCWRYNSQTKIVYWGDDLHSDEEAFRVEDHLDKRYGYEVKSHIDLGNADDSDFETRMKHWNTAHGNLTESAWEVVVGNIDANETVQSKETRETHYECGLHRGKCWRYNPKNQVVYWRTDYPKHDKEDEFRIEGHLQKKYGYEVKSHISLSEDPTGEHWKTSHGYMTEGEGVWGDREEMDFLIVKNGGTVRFGPTDWTRFKIGGVYDAYDVHLYILSQHREFEDDEMVNGYYRLVKMDPKQIEPSEWDVEPTKVDVLVKSAKPFSPIVIDRYESIVDGGHRLEAAVQRGDKEILVFRQI